MPHIKHALIRYRIIDKALRNKYNPFPSKKKFRELCEEALFGSDEGANICDSTIEKDLFARQQLISSLESDLKKANRKFKGFIALFVAGLVGSIYLKFRGILPF